MMDYYITKGVSRHLPIHLQYQLWQLISEREQEQSKDNELFDYFHVFKFHMYNGQLYIKHKQERPEYIKSHKVNVKQPININKVYVIREDDMDLSYYVMLLPEEY